MDPPDRIDLLKSTIYDLQQGNLIQAKESLQKNHQYFQDLKSCELSKPTLQEMEVLNRAEEISVGNVAWSLRTGAVLLPQTSTKNNVFVRVANIVGAVALITICVDIAEIVLGELKEYIEQAEESVMSLGVALNNLGCVYIIKGSYQKAKVSLQRALEVVKKGKQRLTTEETIVTIDNNLRLVYQAQRSHVADLQLKNVSRFAIQPRIIAVIDYNEALTSVDSRNLRKALYELENLKKFCETELDQSKGLLACILLKIRSVCLILQVSNARTTAIDTKISTLQGLKELVDIRTNFSLDFLVTIAETVADIHLYQGNLDLVCSYFSYLVPVVRERCGADHPTLASILSKQGLVFLHLENVARSRQCFTDALEIFTGAFGAVHPDVLKCNASLARLESLGGSEGKSLTHSQKVLENVERICQVSFERQLKPKALELFQRSGRTLSPDTESQDQVKFEILVSEFGVEIARVLNQHQTGDLDDCPRALLDSEDCVDSSVSQLFAEDLCAKLCFNWLKAGLCLFNFGAKQSVAFLFLSCTYASMLYDHCDCSEVILLKVIFVVCHLKSKTSQTFPEVQERLKTEFVRLKNFIEEKAKRVDKPERKTVFFDEKTNLMIGLAVILQSFVEMEMYEMIEAVHSLFSLLSNQQSTQVTHALLVRELRFAIFRSYIQCLGKKFMHNMIFLTPFGAMYNRKINDENDADVPYNFQTKDTTRSLHKDDNLGDRGSRKIFKTLLLKNDNAQWKGSCRFLVECPISHAVDISALNEINVWSLNAVEDILPHLILCSHHNIELATQYFIELGLLDSAETSLSELSGSFSLLPLVLSATRDDSEGEMQSSLLVNTENTCEGSLAFILQDKAIAEILFGKLLKQILINEDELGEVVNVVVKDSQIVLKIEGPPIGQIVMQCHEDTVKVKTQLIHFSQSRRRVETVQEEVPQCYCSLIEMVIADKMKKCARSFGMDFETQSNKARCIASHLNGNQRDISRRGHQALELQHKAERPGRISTLPTLPLRQSVMSESWTQTDAFSIPSTSDLSTQTDLSDSDESENLMEPTSSSSEVSMSSSLPPSSSSFSSSSSSSGEESTDGVSRRSRSAPAEKGSAEPPFQVEAAATATTSWWDYAMDENRRNKEREVESKSPKVWQERKNKNKGDLPGRSHNTRPGMILGLKGGVQDPSFSIRGLSYENLESVTYWNDKDEKSEKFRLRGGDMQNTIDEKESTFFGIKPCFLTRHTDDSSITTPIDEMGNTAENAGGWSSNTYSRHQGSSCFTNEQGFQGIDPFQAPSFPFEDSTVFANAQCPNPYGSFSSNPTVWDLPVPACSLPTTARNGSKHLQTLSSNNPGIVVVPPHAAVIDDTLLAQTPLLPQQLKVKNQCTDSVAQWKRNCDFEVMNGNPARVSDTTSITQGLVPPEMEISALPQGAMNKHLTWETRTLADHFTTKQGLLGVLNDNSSSSNDDSFADLERRVAETCSFVEKALKEREVKEKAMKEKERRKKEERARKEQLARERREREASEARQTECRNDKEEARNPTSGGGETPSQNSASAEGKHWLCEHYQRLCRVKFPCCGKFFPCHRCHNNSGCQNDNSKAREGCFIECSVCSHQQEINQDAHTCARCKTKFSAYFCSVCKHFTGTDKNPYHCTKCGICRIYKDRSFHCDVCNVCLDKRLEGKHSCRENSGHDECCICLEDAFSGCQILPCSHKVHRDCAIAMIQNGVRSCPICRHPLYSQTDGYE